MTQRVPQPLLLLAVDCGGTSTKGALVELRGDSAQVVRASRRGGSNPNLSGLDQARNHLAGLVQELLTDVSRPIAAAAFGVAGRRDVVDHILATHLPDEQVRVMSDVAVPACASPGWREGGVVSVVAGTGSMAVRVEAGQAEHRGQVGGWGWFLGDDAGGAGIGRSIARAVLASHEGGPETVLEDLLADQFGCRIEDVVSRLYADVYQSSQPGASVSKYTPLLTPAIAAGDPAAVAIAQRACRVLVAHAAALYQKGDHIALTGSVALSLRSNLEHLMTGITGGGRVAFFPDGVLGAIAAAADAAKVELDLRQLGTQVLGQAAPPIEATQRAHQSKRYY